jgi:hypothetical protein
MRIRSWLFVGLALSTGALPSQMEKRSDELYEQKTFATANPALGTTVPDLVLSDTDGRPWALSALKGSIVVIVKGGFT